MKKLLVVLLTIFSASFALSSEGMGLEEKYNKSCTFCHGTGAAGAPKTGVKEDWEPRIERGLEELVMRTKSGYGRMPAKGNCYNCSDEDYKALIKYMVSKEVE